MVATQTVSVELCRSNSIGSRYYDPSVIEIRKVSREEAARLEARGMHSDGTYWRIQPPDRTGNS